MKIDLVKNNFLNQLLISGFQFLIYVVVAKGLSINDNGEFVMAMLLANVVCNLGILGLNTSAIYFINSSGVAPRDVYEKMMLIWLLQLTILFPVLYTTIFYFGVGIFPKVDFELLTIGLAISMFLVFLNLMYSIFQGLNKFSHYNRFALSSVFFQFVIICLMKFNGIESINSYLLVILIVNVLISLLVVIYIRQLRSTGNGEGLVAKLKFKAFILFGFKSHLSNVIAFLMSRIDVYMIGVILDPGMAAIYLVAVLFVERLGLVSQSVSTIMLPSMSSLNKEKEKQYEMMYMAFSMNVLVTFLSCIVLSIIIYPLIILFYGLEYVNAVYVFYILVVGVFSKSCARILSVSMSAFGRPELNFYVSLVMILINVSLNLILIPEFGIYGAAIATTISYVVNLIVKLVISNVFVVPLKWASLFPGRKSIGIVFTYLKRI